MSNSLTCRDRSFLTADGRADGRISVGLLLCACASMAACYTPRYSIRSVPAANLAALGSGNHGEELLIADEDGSRVRIGPNSVVRFRRWDGSFSPEYHGRDLRVSAHGIFGKRLRVALVTARRARVSGMNPAYAGFLQKTAPAGVQLTADGQGTATLPVVGQELVSWLQRFIRATAAIQEASAPGNRWILDALGRWSFDLPQVGGWSNPIVGSALIDAISTGVEIRDGIAWSDLQAVQVANVSGGKTFFMTLVVTAGNAAIGVVLLSAAALGAVSSVRWGEAGPRFSGSGRGASAAVQTASLFVPRSGGQPARTDDRPRGEQEGVDWQTGQPPPPGERSQRLFSRSRLRRSIVNPMFTVNSGVDARRPEVLTSSLATTLRLGEAYEIGGGVRHLWLRTTDDHAGVQSLGGFFRLGMIFGLDAARRFDMSLNFDLGGGRDVDFEFRVNFGLRVQVGRGLYLGVYPFNPRYANYSGDLAQSQPNWTYPSSLELGWLL